MGTKANSSDEWIELYNNSSQEIDLSGWQIYGEGGKTLILNLKKKISPVGYYLIERTDNNTIKDISADDYGVFGGNGLSNKGEYLVLKDNLGNIIDQLNFQSGWPAGQTSPDYQSMERGVNGSWQNNNGLSKNGIDTNGNNIIGTPRAINSISLASTITPVSTPASVPVIIPIPATALTSATAPVTAPVPTSTQAPSSSAQTQATSLPITNNQPPINNLPTTQSLSSATSINSPATIKSPLITPNDLFISEIMPNPNGRDKNNEWIEIYNGSNDLVGLSGFYLVGDNDKIFTIPVGEKLASKSFLLLNSQKTKLSLNNKGGSIKLFTSKAQGGLLLSEISYSNLKEGSSWARNTSGRYQEARIPTPGSVNILELVKNINPQFKE
jgi:hypothetical protein